MKAKIIFLTVFLLIVQVAVIFAQEQEMTLTGTMEMATGEKFPYTIVFSETDGNIKGYSLTYAPPNETKTAINGTLDKHRHTLAFKESIIISSHGYHTHAFMCLADAKLEYMQGGSGNVLIGPAIGRETDKTSCTSGTIVFSDEKQLKQLFGVKEHYDTVISMKKRGKDPYHAPEPVKTVAPAPAAPLVTEKITAGIDRSYDWHTDTVVIDLWDGGDIDGDRVTLGFNGKAYLTNYFLLKEKRQLRLPLGAGTNTITIFAENEGSDPPNTASLLLTDGRIQYSVLAYNPRGKQATIRIKRVK